MSDYGLKTGKAKENKPRKAEGPNGAEKWKKPRENTNREATHATHAHPQRGKPQSRKAPARETPKVEKP